MKGKIVKVYGPPFDYRKQAWRDRPILVRCDIYDPDFLRFYGRLQTIVCAGFGVTKEQVESAKP